jgi:hypothetical protein
LKRRAININTSAAEIMKQIDRLGEEIVQSIEMDKKNRNIATEFFDNNKRDVVL